MNQKQEERMELNVQIIIAKREYKKLKEDFYAKDFSNYAEYTESLGAKEQAKKDLDALIEKRKLENLLSYSRGKDTFVFELWNQIMSKSVVGIVATAVVVFKLFL